VLPVNFYIPGCPPRPEAIVYGVALALGAVPKKVAAQHLSDDFLTEYQQLNPALGDEARAAPAREATAAR
jgi:NADH:ubiquinone oxidoreductase subunit B-like Fe-S oxidoreductase